MTSRAYSNPSEELSKTIKLQVALVDAMQGYETMLDKAEPSFVSAVDSMLELHRLARQDVETALRDRGVEPDENGSFMGSVHTTVVSVRSLVDDIDSDLIPQLIGGEESNIEKYDEALEETAADAELSALLSKHRGKLMERINALKQQSPKK